MDKVDLLLTESDKKIRYLWLGCTAVLFGLLPSLCLGPLLKASHGESSDYSLNSYIGLFLIASILFSLLFHFSFNKPGTKLLKYLVYIGVIGLPLSLGMIVKGPYAHYVLTEDPLLLFDFVLSICGFFTLCVWLFFSWKMVKLNEKFTAMNITSFQTLIKLNEKFTSLNITSFLTTERDELPTAEMTPGYLQALDTGLKSATSLEQLDECYTELITNWPQFEPRTTREYTLKKQQLYRK